MRADQFMMRELAQETRVGPADRIERLSNFVATFNKYDEYFLG
jgi:hypothetical protein